MKKYLTILAAVMLACGLSAKPEREGGKKGGPPEGRPSREEVMKKFDKDGDDELEGEEFEAARQWVDRRFKEIRDGADTDKDGQLNTAERAALSKQIEAGKFDDMGWLTRFIVRSPRGGRGDRNRDMRRGESGQSRGGILRRSDKDGDGRLSGEELSAARAALKQFEAEREREERTGIRRVPSRERR